MSQPALRFDRESTATRMGAAIEQITVLVVDDSAFDRQVVARLLEPMKDLHVVFAQDGSAGFAAIERESPAIILTDLIMPDMEGLDLVKQVRALHPQISLILMTAFGSEEIAVRALRAGAANYIAKKDLARDLPATIRQVLSLATIRRERRRINRCMVRRESTFQLDNDPDLIMALLALLQEELEGIDFCDATGLLQVGIALQEALTNALFHGNLELSSQLRQDDEREYEDLAEQRRAAEPYCNRKIHVDIELDGNAARFVVADEGPGFDTELFCRPVQPEDLSRIGGRGLLLIRTFMDQVRFNPIGNKITMVKNRPRPRA